MCVRHRETQTLYVSDVIQPSACSNPGYGKLHVGIYVAAIQETMDRKRRQRQQQLSQTKLPGGAGGNENDEDRDRGSGSGSHHKGSYKLHGGKRGRKGMGKSTKSGFQGPAGKMSPMNAIEVC